MSFDNTQPPPPPGPAFTQPAGVPDVPEASAQARIHPVGWAALGAAVLGFIFACIPGALIVGWILLPVGFILAIVALVLKGKKWPGIVALVLSIVGTVIGFVVFFSLAATLQSATPLTNRPAPRSLHRPMIPPPPRAPMTSRSQKRDHPARTRRHWDLSSAATNGTSRSTASLSAPPIRAGRQPDQPEPRRGI